MSFFRYNDPLQQMFGAMIAALIFLAILKWAFSSNQKMIVLPVSAGKKDQYGLLIPIESAQIKLDIASAQKLLAESKIKATVTDTYDGEQLMVFEKDLGIAESVLNS